MITRTIEILMVSTALAFATISCDKEKENPITEEITVPDDDEDQDIPDAEEIQDTSSVEPEKPIIYVLRERDSKYEFTNYGRAWLSRTKAGTIITSPLGCSYCMKEYPYDCPFNIGFPVMDIDKFIEDHPKRVTEKYLRKEVSDILAFANFESYGKKIHSAKITNGDDAIFINQIKKEAEEDFVSRFHIYDDVRDHVFGEVIDRCLLKTVEMKDPYKGQEDIYLDYATDLFLSQLYYCSPAIMVEECGSYIITKYTIGSRAVIQFMGNPAGSKRSAAKNEQNLETSIRSAIKYGPVGFTLGNGKDDFCFEKFTSIQATSMIYSFCYSFNNVFLPYDLYDLNQHYSADMTRFSDKDDEPVIAFPERSLLPLTYLIEESNLKEIYKEYYRTGKTGVKSLKEPCITVEVRDNQVRSILESRYGDCLFTFRTATVPSEYINDYVQEEGKRLAAMVPYLKIICRQYGQKSDDKFGCTFEEIPGMVISSDKDFTLLDNVSKYVDAKTGKTYILTESSEGKVAYTLFKDYIIEDYCLTDFIEQIPTSDAMTLESIRKDYTLIAL